MDLIPMFLKLLLILLKDDFFKCFKIDEPNGLTKSFLENDPKENISVEEIKANNIYHGEC